MRVLLTIPEQRASRRAGASKRTPVYFLVWREMVPLTRSGCGECRARQPDARPVRLLGVLCGLLLAVASAGLAAADEGIATWYGPGFHGKRMANGLIFDQHDPTTAAANRYALGTWLIVTNVANGLSVTVQVRDRGAFTHALDLSMAAFAQLAELSRGVIRVRITVLDNTSGASAEPARTPTAPAASAAQPQAAPLPPRTVATDAAERPSRMVSSRGGRRALDLDIVPQRAQARRAAFLQRRADAALARVLRPDASQPVQPIVLHIVQPGETLWDIAYAYRTSLVALRAAHPEIVPQHLRVGTVLRVPVPAAATATP